MPDWTDHASASAAFAAITRWHLRAPQHVATTASGLVLKVTTSDGGAAILKCLTAKGAKAEAHAATALSHWNGSGAVSLHAATQDALLIGYCDGPTLNAAAEGQSDDTAIPILCDVACRLHNRTRPTPAGIPTLADRCTVLSRVSAQTAADQALFDRACILAAALHGTTMQTHLLHGDFHHGNVLGSSAGQWRAIDPQPIIGDRAYDFASVIGNPIDQPSLVLSTGRPHRLARIIADKCDLIPERLLAWAFVHACIAAAWSIEDGRDPSLRLALAHAIAPDISRIN